MRCVFPKGMQFTHKQPKNTHGSDCTCIGETGFAGKQDASNRIRGFELSVSGSLWVSCTVFSPPVQKGGVQIA